jgi:hypothetical protein
MAEKDKLRDYRAKRDLRRGREPAGGVRAGDGHDGSGAPRKGTQTQEGRAK